jgi:hypothetical protein
MRRCPSQYECVFKPHTHHLRLLLTQHLHTITTCRKEGCGGGARPYTSTTPLLLSRTRKERKARNFC